MNIKYILLVDLDEPDEVRAETELKLPCDFEHFSGMIERIEVEMGTSDHLGDTMVIYYRSL